MQKKNKKKIKLQTSEALVSALKHYEGLRLEAYKCPGGVWTIGYGHTKNVQRGDKITEYTAEEYLREDIWEVERQVLALDACRKVGELDALVSFAFNVGIGNLRRSTLLKTIKAASRDAAAIMKEFRRWNKAGGRVLKGLVERRQWEMLRFFQDSPYLGYFNEKY